MTDLSLSNSFADLATRIKVEHIPVAVAAAAYARPECSSPHSPNQTKRRSPFTRCGASFLKTEDVNPASLRAKPYRMPGANAD